MTSLSERLRACKIEVRKGNNVINLPSSDLGAGTSVVLPCHSGLKPCLKVGPEFNRRAANGFRDACRLASAPDSIRHSSPDCPDNAKHGISAGTLTPILTGLFSKFVGIIPSIFCIKSPLSFWIREPSASLSITSFLSMSLSILKLFLFNGGKILKSPQLASNSILFAPLVPVFGPISPLRSKICLPVVGNPSPILLSVFLFFAQCLAFIR